jgi:hypothetical protein
LPEIASPFPWCLSSASCSEHQHFSYSNFSQGLSVVLFRAHLTFTSHKESNIFLFYLGIYVTNHPGKSLTILTFSVLNNFLPDLLSFPYFSPSEPKLMSTTNLGEKAAPAKFACCLPNIL